MLQDVVLRKEINEILEYLKIEMDKSKMDRLVEISKGPLYSFALKTCHNIELAKDLVQEAYMIVIQKIAEVQYLSNGLSWMMGIIKFLYKNEQRKLQNFVAFEPYFDIEEIDDMLDDLHYKFLLKKLPPNERMVFYSVVFCGYKEKELATKLKVSEKTVQRRYKSAKLFIEKELKDEKDREINA